LTGPSATGSSKSWAEGHRSQARDTELEAQKLEANAEETSGAVFGGNRRRRLAGGVEHRFPQMWRRRLKVTRTDQAGNDAEAVDLVATLDAGLKMHAELLRLVLVASVKDEGAQQLAGAVVVHG
jgi:hypothetical protein